MTATPEQVKAYWAQYDYTRPIAEALQATFHIGFSNENTGGGCICLSSDGNLENGVYVLIGSALDGPLLTSDERAHYEAERGHPDGYGVGIYDAEDGYSRAMAVDWKAQTPDEVAELVKRALSLLSEFDPTDDTYTVWTRGADGLERRERFRA